MQDPHCYACKVVKILVTNVGMTQTSGTKTKKDKERERRLVREESLSRHRCFYKSKK